MILLRPHQEIAVRSFLTHWGGGGGNALVDLATGTGKSLVGAELSRSIAGVDGRVIVLTHVRELVAQNFSATMKLWPQAPAGIFSAGLNRRDARAKVMFASIQTVFKQAPLIGAADLILIDECHLVPKRGEGMYRRFIDDMRANESGLKVGGLTATPFRLGEGRLDQGGDRLFEKVLYTYGIADGIRDGYLSPLISKAGQAEIDVSKVRKASGDFKSKDLESAAMRIVEEAVSELVERAADRRSWLVFCSGVKHAFEVRDALRRRGIIAETVTGETPSGERTRIIEAFKRGQIKVLTNANVLTTGFDAPSVDVVALMRSTLSTSLYVQMVGRGTRLAPGKENCLVLDFGGNVRRHGPVDAVVPRREGQGGGEEEGKVAEASVMARECPECSAMVHIAVATCPHCEYQFPPSDNPRHDSVADGETPILSTEIVEPQVKMVVDWKLRPHTKRGATVTSMGVEYICGLATHREWVAFEHEGFPRRNAEKWWMQHGGQAPIPRSTAEAITRATQGEINSPISIAVKPRGKYHDIVGRTFFPTKDKAA